MFNIGTGVIIFTKIKYKLEGKNNDGQEIFNTIIINFSLGVYNKKNLSSVEKNQPHVK